MAVRKRRADDGAAAEGRDNVIEAPIVQRRLTVSEILRDRRIECRLEVDHVAQVLMIRPAVLSDIESGRFDQLPGPAYAVGFVRSYATYLGLDAEALVLRFKAEVAEVARRPNLSFPLPLSDTRVPTGPILVICVLLAALTYGGWYYFSERHGRLADLVPAVPERLTHLLNPEQVKQEVTGSQQQAGGTQPTDAPTPTTAPVAATTPPTSQGQPTEPPSGAVPSPQTSSLPAPQPMPQAASAPAAATATPPSAPAPSAPTPAAAATTAADSGAQPAAGATQAAPPADSDGVPPVEDHASPPAGQAAAPATPDLVQPALADAGKATPQSNYGAPEGQARIVLHASADSWIQVRDSQGSLLITRVLKPGDSYNVPNQPGLMMITGNAGGLVISVDGTALRPLGVSGQVIRDIKLDPDRLLGGKPHAN